MADRRALDVAELREGGRAPARRRAARRASAGRLAERRGCFGECRSGGGVDHVAEAWRLGGKIRAGRRNVVELGPKFEKRNVRL